MANTPPSPAVKLELSGLARATYSVVLDKGLTLDGGVLYVDGDLTVQKGVNGYGAVFCTGSLKVQGGSNLGSDSLCALVAGGNLSLEGTGADKTQFRDLVYSYGEIKVSNITLVGSLRANLVYDPKAVSLDFDLQFSGFGARRSLNGGVQLPAGSSLTPVSLYRRGQFQEPLVPQNPGYTN